MKTLKLLSALSLLISAALHAQQAKWELVRENFLGHIAVDPTNPNIIYVAGGASLDKSVDGGQTWVKYEQGYGIGGPDGIVIDPINPQRLWVYGTPFEGIVRSEDGGVTATQADNGISYDHHGYQVTGMAYDHKNDILYAGNQANGFGVYRSFDGGRTWEHMSRYPYVIYPDFVLVEEDSSWVYATGIQGVLRSKDFGKNWTQLQPELLDRKLIFHLASVPNSRTLYAAGRFGGIYKSYDLGDSWFSISSVVTDSVNFEGGLLVSKRDTNFVFAAGRGYAFIAYKGGIFASFDSGKNWQLYHAGLPAFPLRRWDIWSIAQAHDANYLYMVANLPMNGTYKLSQRLLTSVKSQPPFLDKPNFILYQNYPNPFNAETKIEFSAKTTQPLTLEVYSITGKKVSSLFNGRFTIGIHSVVWNGKDSKGGDVASGIYLLRLQAGRELLIHKMLLVR